MELGYFDTKTSKFVSVDTAYNTHHLQLDWQGRIWTDGGGSAAGMLDTKKLDFNNIEGTQVAAQKTYMRVDTGDGEDDSRHGLRRGCQPGRWHRLVFVSLRWRRWEQAVHD